MKWNMIVGSLVLGASLCGQSFGIDLLSRMLGGRGCGCDTSCCDTAIADPSCGCELAPGCDNGCNKGCKLLGGPSCGCEAPCNTGCAAAPSCGCEPSCGAEVSCCKPCKKPLQNLLKRVKCNLPKLSIERTCGPVCCDNGCGAAPTCGCEDPCNKGCAAAPSCGCEDPCGCNKGCKLFKGPSCGCEDPCNKGCAAAPSCGCEAPACGCNAAPSCGCEAVDPCCNKGLKISLQIRRPNLLGKLFKKSACCDACGCDTGCAAAPCSSCGGNAPVAAPAASGEVAPAPPAPVVDPSAYLNSKRRVVQTSFVR